MRAIILSIGDELTTGQCLDTNSQWLSTELGKVGVTVAAHLTVADDVNEIARAIRFARESVTVIIISGGLGPTADDLTREAVASAIDEPLEESAEALDQIKTMFERWQRSMPESNRVQALIPRGCRVLSNSCGTAPGFVHHDGERYIFALPGVPREMRVMFEQSVLPELTARSTSGCIDSRQLRCFGISEAVLGEQIRDLMTRGRNPSVGTTASGAILTIRIVTHGQSRDEVERMLDVDARELHRRLGSVIFGESDDTLQLAVARLLTFTNKTIATAESCTGGLLAKRLTDIPGSSGYFLRGYVSYANESKSDLLGVPAEMIARDGAVSEQVALAMAAGCRERARSDLAVAITGIAGPGGATPPDKPIGLTNIALATPGGVEAKRFLFGEWLARDEIRDRAVKTALNWVRQKLLCGV